MQDYAYVEELQDDNETPEEESEVSSPSLISSDEVTDEKEYETPVISLSLLANIGYLVYLFNIVYLFDYTCNII